MKNKIDFSQFPKPIEEWPISKEALASFSLPVANLLANLTNRLWAQTDLSEDAASQTDIQSPKELEKITRSTLAFKKAINERVQSIQDNIKKLELIEPDTRWQYGLILEQHIPILQERITSVQIRIQKNYKASTTHMQLSEQEIQTIGDERRSIVDELKKFEENIREYI